VGRGPVGPSRGSGRPKASFPVVGARGSLCRGSWARWVRRAVRGARRRPSPWSGPGGSVAVARGPGGSCCRGSGPEGPSPRFGAPEGVLPRGSGPVGPSPWLGGSWVRLAARGARRRPSPWSGPGGSVSRLGAPEGVRPRGRGPWIPLPRVVGPVGPSPRFGAPEGVLPRGSGPGGSVAVARGSVSPFAVGRGPSGPLLWVRAPGGAVLHCAGAVGSLRRRSGLPREPFALARGSVGPSAAGRGPGGSVARFGAPEGVLPRGRGPVGPSPWLGVPWIRRRGSWARWVRRAVRGARRRPSPWSGPGGSVTVARGPWIPFPGSGFRQVLRFGSSSRGSFSPSLGACGSSCRGSWARWVRRAVRGARRRPSPWSGPGGSVTVARGSCGAHRCGSGPGGSVARFGAPEGVLPRGRGPVGPSPQVRVPVEPLSLGKAGVPVPRGARVPRPRRHTVPPEGGSVPRLFRRPHPLKRCFCRLWPSPPSPRGGLLWPSPGAVGSGAPESAGASGARCGYRPWLASFFIVRDASSPSCAVRSSAEAGGCAVRCPSARLQHRSTEVPDVAEAASGRGFPGLPGPACVSRGRRRSAGALGRSPGSPWLGVRGPSAAAHDPLLSSAAEAASVGWGDPSRLEPKPGPFGVR
jgi:hypothetical protein